MKILNTLKLKIDKKEKEIFFGLAETNQELEEMFRLRYQVYSARDYIDADLFPECLEKDVCDAENKCVYFIAKIDDKIIGTVRLIRDYYLPTEKECFDFKEPQDMAKISRTQRAEIGRLIVIPHKINGQYLPRHLGMLFLMDALLKYATQNNILGGYAFIKSKLEKKLVKIKIPFHIINPHTQIYPQNGVIYKYFNQKDDPVVPIYFINGEVQKRLDEILGNKLMFKKIGEDNFVLRENFYNRFLKLLKII